MSQYRLRASHVVLRTKIAIGKIPAASNLFAVLTTHGNLSGTGRFTDLKRTALVVIGSARRKAASGQYISAHSNMSDIIDQEWLNWIEVQKDAVKHWFRGDFESAMKIIAEYVVEPISTQTRSEALAFQGMILHDKGDFEAARKYYLEAHSLADSANFHRYTMENALGSICSLLHQKEESLFWHIRAMQTAILDPTTSGASALKGFLDLKGEQPLTDDEEALCNNVVWQAWALFRLPGEPDLSDRRGVIEILNEASGRPLPTEDA